MEVCCALLGGVAGPSSPLTPWTTSQTGGVRAVRAGCLLPVSGGQRSTGVRSDQLVLILQGDLGSVTRLQHVTWYTDIKYTLSHKS